MEAFKQFLQFVIYMGITLEELHTKFQVNISIALGDICISVFNLVSSFRQRHLIAASEVCNML